MASLETRFTNALVVIPPESCLVATLVLLLHKVVSYWMGLLIVAMGVHLESRDLAEACGIAYTFIFQCGNFWLVIDNTKPKVLLDALYREHSNSVRNIEIGWGMTKL